MYNIRRCVEDLVSTLPLLNDQSSKNRVLHPSAAILRQIGRIFIDCPVEDRAYAAFQNEPWELAPLADKPTIALFSGRLNVSYLLAGVAFAGATQEFPVGPTWNWPEALEWLVLDAIPQHALWHLLSRQFIHELNAPTIAAAAGYISPLQLIVLRRRPQLRRDWPTAGSDEFERAFRRWLLDEGIMPLGLFWACNRAQVLDAINFNKSSDNGRFFVATRRDEIIYSQHEGRLPGEPEWRAPTFPTRDLLTDAATIRFRHFNQDFPCLTLNCLERSLIDKQLWAGLVRLAPDGTNIEILEPAVRLRLPQIFLRSSVLILGLVVVESLRDVLWVKVELDGREVDIRPASYYSGRPVNIFVPDRIASSSNFLVMQFEFKNGGSAHSREVRLYANLFSIRFWQLDSNS